ncbi:hypothetical protein [Actinomadura gamaensis]|uniref:Uncharacterized protein n=1 Tax=Actinomadura gamaensis TaxID=1763541 RepID=A0ABV9TTD9_9ACTN
MSQEQHPDPFTEGLTIAGQRLVQALTIATVVKQGQDALTRRLAAARRAKDEAAAQREEALARAIRDEARARWVPAHDREWLGQADLYETGQAWTATLPYLDTVASARSAAEKCEARLRELHPYAMHRYDELRAEGKDRLEAMQGAAPFFANAPHTRPGDVPARQQALPAGTGTRWAANPHGPTRADLEKAQERERALEITKRLRDKVREKGHDPSAAELRTMLEVTTNLPEDVITEVVPLRSGRGAGSGIDTPEAALADAAFPFTIDEALAMQSARPVGQPPFRRHPNQVPERNRRRNL